MTSKRCTCDALISVVWRPRSQPAPPSGGSAVARLLESELVDLWPLEGRVPRVGVGLGSFLTISFLTIATLVFLAELTLWLAGDATRPVERVNLVLGLGMFGSNTGFFVLLAELLDNTEGERPIPYECEPPRHVLMHGAVSASVKRVLSKN